MSSAVQHVGTRWRSFVRSRLWALLRDNGLSITLAGLFLGFWWAQSLAGHRVYNDDQLAHQRAPVAYVVYLTTDHFAEATFENWESEFLQMAMYIVLTALLFQRGSAESNDPDRKERRASLTRESPRAARAGGWIRVLYEHSLSIAFAALFLASFYAHGRAGAAHYNAEQLTHGEPTVGVLTYFATAQFWFESFQNWQSEFLAILSMVV